MEVLSFDGKVFKKEEVELIKEEPFTIFLNGKEFITLLCYPKDLRELGLGFLKSEGLIGSLSEVKKISFSRDEKDIYIEADISELEERLHEKRIVTTGCGKGSIFYFALDSLKCREKSVKKIYSYIVIQNIMREISRSRGNRSERGLHVCAIYNGERLIIKEDVGRHNALDKIVGYCMLNNIDTDDSIVFTTGRISSEILLKTAKTDASVIVSRSTPTNLAIELAKKLNITVVGYVRGVNLTIYSGEERITTSPSL